MNKIYSIYLVDSDYHVISSDHEESIGGFGGGRRIISNLSQPQAYQLCACLSDILSPLNLSIQVVPLVSDVILIDFDS